MVIRDTSGRKRIRAQGRTGGAEEADCISSAIAHLFPGSLPWLQMWDNAFISWNPEECASINKLTVSAENLWLPDIFIVESCVSGLGKASRKPICKKQPRGSARHRDIKRVRQGTVSIN